MSNRYSKIMLIAVTIICVIFMAVSYINSAALDTVRSYANYILVPIQKSISAFGQATADSIDENVNLHNVYKENEELQKSVDKLTAENNKLRNDQLELERLRELYKLDQDYQQYPTVAARVISRDSQKWFDIFRIDKGLADGLTRDMNVIGGGGLIGIIVDVGPDYATVRSIIDEDSNVYAMSQYSGDACLVKGSLSSYESGMIELSNIDKNAVFNNGDAVVTSDLSTKFLPGILIGYASDISIDSQHLTKSGKLIPVADFNKLREVLVITQIKTDTGIISMGDDSQSNAADAADSAVYDEDSTQEAASDEIQTETEVQTASEPQ